MPARHLPAIDPRRTTPRAIPLRLDASGRTDRGFERRDNEDNFLVASLGKRLRVHETSLDEHAVPSGVVEGDPLLAIVADGMGGMQRGALASTLAVRTVADQVARAMPLLVGRTGAERAGALRKLLETAIDEAHKGVVAASRPGGPMGTTTTAALVIGDELWLAHVGDSRCYLLRGDRLTQLTVDHTMAQQLAELGIAEHAAGLEHVLWKAVGAPQDAVHVQPDVSVHEVLAGDVLLLCSDGLGKHVQEDEICAVLSMPEPARALANRLVDIALARGGSDNVTTLVVRAAGGLRPPRASHEGN
jgi:PPM family protein phosphatase